MRWFSTIVSLFFCTISTHLLAQGRLETDFSPKLIPIVNGIYAYEGYLSLPGEDEIIRTNSLVVITNEGVVVVDGQDDEEKASALITAISAITDQPIRYLINASPHGDHVNGNAVFKESTIIAHEKAKQSMISTGVSVLPSIVYAEEMTLHLGGMTLELHYFGPAHTAGDTIVYIPEERVAFLSEIYFNGVFTSLIEGFSESHIKAIELTKALDVEWFIPGHGIIDGKSAKELSAGLDVYLNNVKAVHNFVLKHIVAGDSMEKTLSFMDTELHPFTEVPFYHYLGERSVRATFEALSN